MSLCTLTRQYVRTSILSHHMLLGNLGVLERLQSLGHATCVLASSLRSVSSLHLCIKLRITTSTVEVFRIAACLCTASSDFLSGYHGCNMNNTFGQGGICDCFLRCRRYRVALELRQRWFMRARGRRKTGSELAAGSQRSWAGPSAVASSGSVSLLFHVWAEAEVIAAQQRRGPCGRQ